MVGRIISAISDSDILKWIAGLAAVVAGYSFQRVVADVDINKTHIHDTEISVATERTRTDDLAHRFDRFENKLDQVLVIITNGKSRGQPINTP